MYNYPIRLTKKLLMTCLRTKNIRKHLCVEPKVKDAQTIETETQTTINKFFKLKQEFDKVNNSATEQKSQTEAINLVDHILEYNHQILKGIMKKQTKRQLTG